MVEEEIQKTLEVLKPEICEELKEGKRSPKELLSLAVKQIWATAPFEELKKNLKYIGKEIVKPAYEEASEKAEVGTLYREQWSRRVEIEALEERLKALKKKKAEIEKAELEKTAE